MRPASFLLGALACTALARASPEATPLPWEEGGDVAATVADAQPNPALDEIVREELTELNGAPVDAGSASGVDAPLEVRDGDSERAGDVGPVSVEGVLDVAATGPDGETDGADTNTERRAARENEGGWRIPLRGDETTPPARVATTQERLSEVIRRVDNAARGNKNWGFDLKVDSAVSRTVNYWGAVATHITAEDARPICALKSQPMKLEIAIDQLVASKANERMEIISGAREGTRSGARVSLLNGAPENIDAEQETATGDLTAPAADAVPDNRDNDAAERAVFGDRTPPVVGTTPTEEQVRDANAGPDAILAEAAARGSGGEDSNDLLLQQQQQQHPRAAELRAVHESLPAGETYDDAADHSIGLGVHAHTAVHAIRRLRRTAAPLAGADLLFEGYEHESTVPEGQTFPGLPDNSGRIELANGVKVSYSEVIALAGDFYGDPTCPISTGSIDGASQSTSITPTTRDARELVVKKVYGHCGWSYSERETALKDKCASTPAHGRSAIERRFIAAYNTLNYGNKAELKKILEIFKDEHKRIRGPQSATIDYLDAGNDINFEYAKATGSELMAMPRPFGVAPVGGRFIDLAGVNWDHFGRGGWNKNVYMAGHMEAMRLAAQAKVSGDTSILARAYLMNAYADHFLTDIFSSGHYRNLRRKLHECCTVSTAGGNLPWGDLMAKYQHDEDNFHGLMMTSKAERGRKWKAYGDKMWFNDNNRASREVAQRAVAMSIKEVSDAYESGEAPARSVMHDYFAEETDVASNLRPLFKIVGGDLKIREPLNDPFHPSPDYTGAFVAGSSYFKLRRIAWEREYWYKHENPAPADSTTDAVRYFSAHDGAGTDELVMLELLALRSNAEIRKMKQMYAAAYPGRSIVGDTKGDTSGDFESLLVHMLKATKAEGAITTTEARRLAQRLYDAGEDKWGTDEAAFIAVLGGNSMRRNEQIARAYRSIGDMTLHQAIADETSGTFAEALALLIPRGAKASGHDWAAAAASRVHKAMAGWGTNSLGLASVLRRFDNAKLRKVIAAFETKYGKALRGEIESETSGATETCMVRLLSTSKSERALTSAQATAAARQLKAAGEDKWGTDEGVFIRVLCGTSRPNARKIAEAYGRISRKSLSYIIADEFSGDTTSCVKGCIA